MISPKPSFRKIKGDTTKTVDLAGAPPIDGLDMDHLQDLPKELIRSYLIHYDVEPADTKPDMKKQLRRLVSSIINGDISKRPVPGGEGAPQVDRTNTPGFPSAAASGAATPAPTASAGVGTPFAYGGAPQSLIPSGDELIQYYSSLEPQTFAMAQAFGLTPSVRSFSKAATWSSRQPDLSLPVVEDDDAENTCMGCGKRANRECRYRRCKNCCVAAVVRCSVHARYVPLETRPLRTLLTAEEFDAAEKERQLEVVPPTPVPESVQGPVEAPRPVSRTLLNQSQSIKLDAETLQSADKMVIDEDDDDFEHRIQDVLCESASKRLKLNLDTMAEVFQHDRDQTIPALLSTLRASKKQQYPTGNLRDYPAQANAEMAAVKKRMDELPNFDFEGFLQGVANAKSIQELEQRQIAYEKHFKTNLREAIRAEDQANASVSHPMLYQLIPRKRDRSDVHIPAHKLTVL